MRTRPVTIGVVGSCIAALLAMAPVTAQADGPNAVRNLLGCTLNTLEANDDNSTGSVPIGFEANFFGNPHTELFVNNNGNVTFGGSQSEYTPFDFTTSGEEMIAPFLADVDTRGAPGNGASEVTYGQTSVGGHDAFCVNWVNVGYYDVHIDKTNSFQLLLIDQGSGDFDIEFNYDRILWETGDASGGVGGFGGTPAAAGFANGDGDPSHFFVRDGSFSPGALIDGGPKALVSGALNSGGQLGRYVFHVHNAPPTGATLRGQVKSPEGFPVPGAPVEICPVVPGKCIARLADGSGTYRATNLPAGSYEVTARSASTSPAYADGHAGPVAVSGIGTFEQDVTLGPELGGPPPGTELESVYESEGGIPVLNWTIAATLTVEGCVNGTASYEVVIGGTVVQSGSMTESPAGSGVYRATIKPLYPEHGQAEILIEIEDCETPESIEFAAYIDPSGVVRDADTGTPIANATVTLYRSADAEGPFIQVPDGSVVMSAANRSNPDLTGSDGRFGWDVIAGFYKVSASAAGCQPASTGVLDIPPPVTDLSIELHCGNGSKGGGAGGAGPTSGPAPSSQPLQHPAAKKHKKRKGCHRRRHGHKKKCPRKKKHHGHARWIAAHGVLAIPLSDEAKP